MADYFGDRYFPPRYFPPGYFEGGEQNPGAMSASLSGAGATAGELTPAQSPIVSIGGAGGGGSSGTRWWEESRYRVQRKARRWAQEELDDLVAAAFESLGIDWGTPITARMRAEVRAYVTARSHELNVLLPPAASLTRAIAEREQVNVDLRDADEDDTLLLLAA
jgi:hypothetical protein